MAPLLSDTDLGQLQVEFLAAEHSWADQEIGHAFMIISYRTGTGIKEDCYGFYPKDGLGVIAGPGIVISEFTKNPSRMSRVTVSIKRPITEAQRRTLLKVAEDWNKAQYALATEHCADFIDAAADALGWNTPTRDRSDHPTAYLQKLKEANPPAIEGFSRSQNMDHYINSDPRLPPLTLVLDTDDADFVGWEREGVTYSSVIEYRQHGRADRVDGPSGESTGTSATLDFGGIIQGGILTVTARLFLYKQDDQGDHFGSKDLVFKVNIKGRNPTKTSIRARLQTTQLLVIAYKESRFRQFDSEGLSLWGPGKPGKSGGFGIMQLDTPAPTPRQLWDWEQNIDGGKSLFTTKQGEVRQHFRNIKAAHPEAPDLTQEQFTLALYQYYNGGYYWDWDAASKKWVKVDTTGYADDFLHIQKLVEAGTPPDDWD